MGTGSGRGPVRRVWLSVAACALVALVLPVAASAATITVDVNTDANGADPANCELREAITAANSNVATDGCAAGTVGADTIDFTPALLAAPIIVSVTGTPLPSVTEQVTLDGTDGLGCAGTGRLVIDGTAAGAGDGLALTGSSDGSTVCGVLARDFANDGFQVDTDNNSILGSVANNNGLSGLIIGGGDGNVVRGSRFGTNAAGNLAVPNAFGVAVSSDGQNNVIGGAGAVDGNVISGNDVLGVLLEGTSTGTRVEGNSIGTDAAGTAALPNGQQGIRIASTSSANFIGDDASGAGNLISGNNLAGVQINGPNNVVQGNFIGTDVAGGAALPNGQPPGSAGAGIEILGPAGTANNVGGADTSTDALGGGARNLISGNAVSGVRIDGPGADGNNIQGNFIGTNVAGTAPLPNGTNIGTDSGGVNVEDGAANVVGGTAAGAGNLISGNAQKGVWVYPDVEPGTRLEGNLIGTNRTGAAPLANAEDGVQVDGSGASIGGTGAGAGNTIAHNGDNGILVVNGNANPILRNSIHSNGAGIGDLGIDLFAPGVTENDNLDPDLGANNLQNFPVLTGAQTNSVDTTIQGTLNSEASQSYKVEFFTNAACDDSGNGEGRTFLGATDVTTNGSGDATIAATLSPSTAGQQLTATATRLVAGSPTDTSEFSDCQAIATKAEPPAPTPTPDPGGGGGGGGGTGGGGGGGGGGITPDTRAPELDVGGDSKQDSDKKVTVEVTCDEACTVDGTGTIKVPETYKGNGEVKSKEKFDLKGADEIELEAGDTEKLKLEFKNKAGDLVEKAFKKKEKSTAKVTADAVDAAGNETVADKFEIKVKK